jgi:hypothetical protein
LSYSDPKTPVTALRNSFKGIFARISLPGDPEDVLDARVVRAQNHPDFSRMEFDPKSTEDPS